MENITREITTVKKPDIQVDIQKWSSKIISFWWLFLLGLIIAIPSGQIYLRYATPLYSAKAKLLIKGVGSSGNLSETSILVEELGINSGGKDMDNEMQILTSRPIIIKTIEEINAHVTYYRQGRVKDSELYKESPLKLNSFQLVDGMDKFSFFIKMGYYDDFKFMIEPESKQQETYKLGVPFTNKFGEFLISRNKIGKFVPGIYQVNIMPAIDVANRYQKQLSVELVGAKRSSSILELKLIDPTAEKATDFINTLIDVYNREEISDNTLVLKNTIAFIDERITSLTAELDELEGDIERYKSEHEIITHDATTSLGFALAEMRSSFAKLSSYQLEQDLLISLEDNFKKIENKNQLIPVNVATTNISLGNLVSEYNNLLLQQKKLEETVTKESPIVMSNYTRLEDLKNLILTTVQNLRQNLEIPIANTNREIEKLKGNMRNIPSVEKELLEKLRLQSVKQNLFLFLLQKREETALSQAITTANTRIIESARSTGQAIFPNKKLILIASSILGLSVPLLIIAILALFETTVNSEDILKSITAMPIIGRISHNKSKDKIIVSHGGRSAISEMFRLLRANLNYTNLSNEKQVIMVTSSVPKEGKSVTTINLGLTIALSKKKTVVVGMDLRKPTVSEYLSSTNTKGVTNYLTGQSSLDEILNEYEGNEYFHFISSGPIPPDPSELIMSSRMTTLLDELKKEFDYVLLDTPPLGIVADAMLFRDYITNTLLIVRHKYTRKDMLRHLEELNAKGELVRPSIILNDIKITRGQGGYGGYNKYYGAGYYSDDNLK